MKQKYDIVIVGSGLGGLLCGAILSKYGYSACVLEKHTQIGGNLQSFVRKGKKFSTGMHYVGCLEEGQILNKIFKFLGITNNVEFEKLDDDCFEKIFIGENEYCYPLGIENFSSKLKEFFPEEKEAIDLYISKITEVWNSNSIINLKDVDVDAFYNNEFLSTSVAEVINNLTNNNELRAVLTATNALYAGIPNRTPFYLHALINYFFIQSAHRIKGGSCNLANALKKVIEDHNGIVVTQKEVVKFQIENDNAISVSTKDNCLYVADYFISNIHPVQTNILIGNGYLRKAYINRINNLENGIGSFVVYFSLKKESFKNFNYNVYYSINTDVWAADYDDEAKLKGYMLYTNYDESNKEYAESATAIIFMKYSEVKKWENTTVGKRGSEYRQFKEEKAKKILDLIKIKFPDFEQCIDGYWTSTPLTYRDYTGIPEGSMYGIFKDCNNVLQSHIAPNMKIKNLFLVGQNIGFHGIMGVAMNSIIGASNITGLEKIISDIKNDVE